MSLTVARGSVHALIGLNGSGKSTLVKILSGYHRADSGTMSWPDANGRRAVAFVQQDLGLLPSLSVLENFSLGRPPALRFGKIDWKTEGRRAQRALRPFGLARRLSEPIGSLTKAEAAIVAMARALDQREQEESGALVLDEPTSALPAHEIEALLGVIREQSEQGVGVLFITHRLEEVERVADQVTILRNGRVAFAGRVADLDRAEMIAHMVGSTEPVLTRSYDASPDVDGGQSPAGGPDRPVLECDGLTGDIVESLNLGVRGGEIVGICGMVGGGIGEIGTMLSGRQEPVAGQVTLQGTRLEPRSAATRNIAFVPGDRVRHGVLPGLSVRENLSVLVLGDVVASGRISRRRERQLVRRWIEQLHVFPTDPELPVLALSGGNQQKVVLGRQLAATPAAIVAEEVTRGVDLRAKAQLLRYLRRAANEGAAVVLLTVEPEEIVAACDRVLAVRQGRIAREFRADEASVASVMTAMH